MFNEPLANPANRTGWIEVITGPMFSGKTEELIRRLRRAGLAHQRVETYHPEKDIRAPVNEILSHNKVHLESQAVDSAVKILEYTGYPDVIGIDECQFFGMDLIGTVNTLAGKGVRVIASGLDMDYRQQPFGPMPALMACCEILTKMHAICMGCGNPASFSYRKSGAGGQILIGDMREYEALCRKCFNERID